LQTNAYGLRAVGRMRAAANSQARENSPQRRGEGNAREPRTGEAWQERAAANLDSAAIDVSAIVPLNSESVARRCAEWCLTPYGSLPMGVRHPAFAMAGVRHQFCVAAGCQTPFLRHCGCQTPFLRHCGCQTPFLRHCGCQTPFLRHCGCQTPFLRHCGCQTPFLRRRWCQTGMA